MKIWWALCKREWLEHRIGLGWTPLAVLGLLVVISLLALWVNSDNVVSLSQTFATAGPSVDASDEQTVPPSFSQTALGDAIRSLLTKIAQPFVWLYFGIGSFVLLGSLFDDRKDRSVLFWKSVPVSDTQTVLSKLFVVTGMSALATLVVIVMAQLYLVAFTSLALPMPEGMSAATLWREARLGSSVLAWSAGFFTQTFWSLPLWGWLLLVSSVARSLPILWAILLPAVPVLLEWALFDSSHLFRGIVRHLEARALPPHIHNVTNASTDPSVIAQIASLWASSSLWLGLVTGVVFCAGAIFFRQRDNEL